MNSIVLAGRLTADPEHRQTNSGIDVTSFTVAVNRPYSKNSEVQADFIPCVAWRGTANFVQQYFNKGDGVVLRGRLMSEKWVADDGANRISYKVQVENVEFPQGKKQSGNSQSNGYTQQPPATAPAVGSVTGEYVPMPEDNDLPF